MLPFLLLPLARAADAPPVMRACVDTAASASASVRSEILAQKGEDAAEDARSGAPSVSASVKRSWAWEKSLDLCPPDDPTGGLLIPGDKLFEVDLPVPGQPRTCVTHARAGADGTAEGAVAVDENTMHVVAAGRAGVQVTATNASEVDTSWTGGGRFATRWRWNTLARGIGTTALKARIRIEASPTAAGTLEIPDLAKLTIWENLVEGHVRRGATWEVVSGPPPMELYAEAVLVGTKGELCAMGDVSAVTRANRTSGRLTSAARIEVQVDAVERSDYPGYAKGGPEFSGCACP
jgi:hypothetical protein